MYSRFASVYDLFMKDVDRDAWLKSILSLFDGANIKTVADCACGTGALSIPLAKLGYNVTGLDISEEMLAKAAANARAARVNIPFVRQDMRHLALHRPQDAVLAVCDGVNYLSQKGAQSFFTAAYNALKPGGLLLFDVSSRHKLERVLGCNTFAEDEGEAAYIWKNIYDGETKLLSMELTLFERLENGSYSRFTESQVQRAHSKKELTGALERAGFENIEVFEAFTLQPPQQDCERLQFKAVKPRCQNHAD